MKLWLHELRYLKLPFAVLRSLELRACCSVQKDVSAGKWFLLASEGGATERGRSLAASRTAPVISPSSNFLAMRLETSSGLLAELVTG